MHHMLPNEDCTGTANLLTASDGSGWTAVKDVNGNYIVRRNDGLTILPSGIIEDTNGNQITVGTSTVTDTLGRVFPSNGLTYYDSAGNTQVIQIIYENVSLDATSFCAETLQQTQSFSCKPFVGTMSLPHQIILPPASPGAAQLTYTINHVSGLLGQPSSIILPSGQTISYAWAGASVTSRTVTADGIAGTWQYTLAPAALGSYTTTIRDPDNNDTVLTWTSFTCFNDFTNCGPASYITQKQVFKGLSTASPNHPVRTEVTTYSTTGPVRSTSVTTTLNEVNQVRVTRTTYDGNLTNPVTIAESDWGLNTPGPTLRTTALQYLHNVNSIYDSRGMFDRVTDKQVVDNASGNRLILHQQYGYDAGTITATGVSTGHDSALSSTYLWRGNVTSISRFLDTTSSWLPPTTKTYDDLGNLLVTTDPGGHPTTNYYDDNFANGGCAVPANARGYVTRVVNALGQTTKLSPYPCTGFVHSMQDQNDLNAGRAGTTQLVDALNRPTVTTFSDNGQTTVSYIDAPPLTSTTTRIASTADRTKDIIVTEVFNDRGLMRTSQRSDPDCSTGVRVDYTYDARGRKSTQTNPYCATSDETYGVTSYQYNDPLSRITRTQNPDGTGTDVEYVGRAVHITDPGNGSNRLQRVTQTDGLGRLAKVCEVTSVSLLLAPGNNAADKAPSSCGLDLSATGFLTTYSYDVLGNLTTVTQGGLQPRTFSYDSLSRLVSTTNPESGTTSYTYDADGNLTTRTRPAPNQTTTSNCTSPQVGCVTTTYSYEQLHRLTQIAYSETTPTVILGYDSQVDPAVAWGCGSNCVGRMTTEFAGATGAKSSTVFSYDPVGRITGANQCSPVTCGWSGYAVRYSYDLVGDILTATNGLGVTFTYTYSNAGSPTSMTSTLNDASHPGTLWSSVHYNPAGAAVQEALGNGVTENYHYATRLWLTSEQALSPIVSAGSQSSATLTINGVEKTQAAGPGQPATASSATLNVTGTLLSRVNPTQPGTKSSGWISVSGNEQSMTDFSSCRLSGGTQVCNTIWDFGTVTATIGSFSASVGYNKTSTLTSVATALAAALGAAGSPVTVTGTTTTPSAVTISFSSVNVGVSSNVTIVTSAATSDSTDFSRSSFFASRSGLNMTGGTDPIASTTTFDAGTVFVTVGTFTAPAPYAQGSTVGSIATALRDSLNTSSIVHAALTATGSGVIITSVAQGVSTNYAMNYSAGSSHGFSPASFAASGPGQMSGGLASVPPPPTSDAGNLSVTINNYKAHATYDSSSTKESLAASLASSLQLSPDVTVLSVSGSTITLQSKALSSSANYVISPAVTSTAGFAPPSFSIAAPGFMTGGVTPGKIPLYTLALSHLPNGDIDTASDSNGNWQYTYDDFNRLTSSVRSGTDLLLYMYDRFGNRWQETRNGTAVSSLSFTAKNRVDNGSPTCSNNTIPFCYDAAGNLMNDGTNRYTYDAENRITSTQPLVTGPVTTYTYDANGRRTESKVGTVITDYVYDSQGRRITDVDGSVNWLRSEIYVGASHVATYADGTTYFNHADWLGTERVRTNMSGVACRTNTSLPFGDGESSTGGCFGSPNFFTGKERDSETGLDYFGARYYNSSIGRWITPDWSEHPSTVPYAQLPNPQTLNLFAYVGNNPVSGVDPDGHFRVSNGQQTSSDSEEQEGEDRTEEEKRQQSQAQTQAQSQNNNPTFTNLDKAAAASARADQKLQKKNGGEYGSLVYSADGKTFTYTTPVTQGEKTAVDPFNTTGVPQSKTVDLGNAPIPAGTQLYAETHSHPDVSGFSGEDVQRAHDLTIGVFRHPDFKGEYVGLPNGNVIKYDPATGKQYTFAPGQP
jgi:RHS repeat-associated protein